MPSKLNAEDGLPKRSSVKTAPLTVPFRLFPLESLAFPLNVQ